MHTASDTAGTSGIRVSRRASVARGAAEAAGVVVTPVAPSCSALDEGVTQAQVSAALARSNHAGPLQCSTGHLADPTFAFARRNRAQHRYQFTVRGQPRHDGPALEFGRAAPKIFVYESQWRVYQPGVFSRWPDFGHEWSGRRGPSHPTR